MAKAQQSIIQIVKILRFFVKIIQLEINKTKIFRRKIQKNKVELVIKAKKEKSKVFLEVNNQTIHPKYLRTIINSFSKIIIAEIQKKNCNSRNLRKKINK